MASAEARVEKSFIVTPRLLIGVVDAGSEPLFYHAGCSSLHTSRRWGHLSRGDGPDGQFSHRLFLKSLVLSLHYLGQARLSGRIGVLATSAPLIPASLHSRRNATTNHGNHALSRSITPNGMRLSLTMAFRISPYGIPG